MLSKFGRANAPALPVREIITANPHCTQNGQNSFSQVLTILSAIGWKQHKQCTFRIIGPYKGKKLRKIAIIFLSISLNMCFGCSIETVLLSTHNICFG